MTETEKKKAPSPWPPIVQRLGLAAMYLGATIGALVLVGESQTTGIIAGAAAVLTGLGINGLRNGVRNGGHTSP